MMTYDAETVLREGLRTLLGLGEPPKGKPVRHGRMMFYPWLDMEIGEAFTFRDHVKIGSARVLSCRASNLYAPRKYRTRTVRSLGRKFVICTRVR
jgi:hypothetical protein